MKTSQSSGDEEAPLEYSRHLASLGFVLKNEIGAGLSGRVYRAWQPRLERSVAVKFCDGDAAISDSLSGRFKREGRLLAAIQHPSVPYVITNGQTPEGVAFTALEYIEGLTLTEVIKAGPLEPARAVHYARQVLDALAATHHAGVLHRDVKPGNIIVSNRGCVLIDFSIGVETRRTRTDLTSTGSGIGSFDYMPPEQEADMKSVDHRADIYSLGVTLFEMLAGHPRCDPQRIDGDLQMAVPGLRDAVKRACSTDPDDRFESATAFRKALQPFTAGSAKEPHTGICTSHKCPGADWSSRGYYRGPRVIKSATSSYCGQCGSLMLSTCSKCGAEYDESQYCGNCGQQWYAIPVCENCGSWLEVGDMGTDTEKDCCGKGRRKKEREQSSSDRYGGTGFLEVDDTPF